MKTWMQTWSAHQTGTCDDVGNKGSSAVVPNGRAAALGCSRVRRDDGAPDLSAIGRAVKMRLDRTKHATRSDDGHTSASTDWFHEERLRRITSACCCDVEVHISR